MSREDEARERLLDSTQEEIEQQVHDLQHKGQTLLAYYQFLEEIGFSKREAFELVTIEASRM